VQVGSVRLEVPDAGNLSESVEETALRKPPPKVRRRWIKR
jgi:hypothetical protein